MVCTEYQERINEAALQNSPANLAEVNSSTESQSDADLQKHLAVCSGCREEFELRRALMTRIDFGVAAMVAGDPSPALAVLVRQRIAEETGESRSFTARWGWWIGATAAAAALAAIIFAVTTHSPAQMPSQPASVASQPAQNVSPPAPQLPAPVVQAQHSPATIRKVPQHHESVVATRAAEIGPPRFEVIVPPGQREAVIRLAAGLQSGRVDGAVFVNPAPSLVPDFLEIAPLEIKPLAVGADSGSQADETKNLDPAVRN